MTNEEWLEANANLVDSTIPEDLSKVWVSKIDESYIVHEASTRDINHIVDRGLTQVQNMHGVAGHSANIGYNEEEKKWYGWSHRAFYGFGIGSKVVKGDCAYQATDKDDYLEDMVRFWSDPENENVKGEHVKWDDNNYGVKVSWVRSMEIPNEKLRGTVTSSFSRYPDEYGKGEWEAKTLDDARQMACDFAEGVS